MMNTRSFRGGLGWRSITIPDVMRQEYRYHCNAHIETFMARAAFLSGLYRDNFTCYIQHGSCLFCLMRGGFRPAFQESAWPLLTYVTEAPSTNLHILHHTY